MTCPGLGTRSNVSWFTSKSSSYSFISSRALSCIHKSMVFFRIARGAPHPSKPVQWWGRRENGVGCVAEKELSMRLGCLHIKNLGQRFCHFCCTGDWWSQNCLLKETDLTDSKLICTEWGQWVGERLSSAMEGFFFSGSYVHITLNLSSKKLASKSVPKYQFSSKKLANKEKLIRVPLCSF